MPKVGIGFKIILNHENPPRTKIQFVTEIITQWRVFPYSFRLDVFGSSMMLKKQWMKKFDRNTYKCTFFFTTK